MAALSPAAGSPATAAPTANPLSKYAQTYLKLAAQTGDEEYLKSAMALMTKDDNYKPETAQGKVLSDYQHGAITKQQYDSMASVGGIADTGLTGQAAMDYLKEHNKGLASDVQMALRGDYPMTSMSSRNQHTLDVMQAANMVDPTFSPTTYQARVATAKDFAPAGKSGQTLVAINTSASHLADLKEAYEELHNSGFTAWNYLTNNASRMTDNKTHQALNRFQTALNAVAPELAKIYSGTGTVAEGEIKHRRDAFNPNDGPESMRAALNEAASLIKGKSDSLVAAYQQNMGQKKPPTFQPFTDKALKEFADLGIDLSPANLATRDGEQAGASGNTVNWVVKDGKLVPQ
jgi:hypothetical protein